MKLWNQLSWPAIQASAEQGDVVLLPVGVIEQHGLHLPVDTDAYLAAQIVREAARRESTIMAGPSIEFGYTPSNRNFPGSISLGVTTWMDLVSEVVQSIAAGGFRRIAIVNGHGGQVALSRLTSAFLGDQHGLRVIALDWFGLVEDDMRRLFSDEKLGGSRVGHAGAVETSLNLYLRPDLSDQGELVSYTEGSAPGFVKSAGGFLQTPREDVSPTGVLGDPTLASADKGAELYELAVTRLVEFAGEFRSFEHVAFDDEPGR